jgi:cytochrome c peroxidase
MTRAPLRPLFFASCAPPPINLDSIAKAIAAFERTLEPGTAPFDRWIEGDETAISDAARRGFAVFNTSRCINIRSSAVKPGLQLTTARTNSAGVARNLLG